MAARRLCVPTIGDTLTLTAPWTFLLHPERSYWGRNRDFAESLGHDTHIYYHQATEEEKKRVLSPREVTLPAGSKLKVRRVYIRSTNKDFREFDTYTFSLNMHVSKKKTQAQGLKRGRFFVKLADVNKILCTVEAG